LFSKWYSPNCFIRNSNPKKTQTQKIPKPGKNPTPEKNLNPDKTESEKTPNSTKQKQTQTQNA